MKAESHLDRSVAFKIAGRQYHLSGREVLDRARLILIDPSQVPETLYERTKRFAQACRVRAEVQT